MSKSKFVIDKLAKLFEQGLVSYKDLNSEILNILSSKRDKIIFRMKLTSKEETDILNKRIENLEKKIDKGRSETKSSVGLGLSISSDIIRSHGGTIKLRKSKTGGLEVMISLPV